MAIDTAEKRKSVAGIPFFIGLGVTPKSDKDQEWRQQAGWSYSGILAGAGVDEPEFIFASFITITLPQAVSVSISLPSAINVSLPDDE